MANSNQIALDTNNKPAVGVYDSVSHAIVTLQAGTTATDATTGVVYAPLATGGINIAQVNGAAVPVDPAGVFKVSLARYGITFYTLASAAQTANGNSADQFVQNFSELQMLVNITAVSGSGSPTATFFIDTKDSFGNYYPIFTSTAQTATGQVIASIGAGLSTAAAFGSVIRFRWTITGTTPSFTFSCAISGK